MTTDWQMSRRMTPLQYRLAAGKLGLNVSSLGRFLGVSPRTSARYATGDTEIPEACALLLGLMIHFNIEPIVPSFPRWRKL